MPRCARIAPREPIPAEVKGLGWYPNPHHPRVFWVGVDGGDALIKLVKDIDGAAAGSGIATEDRPFNAHLTLARIKEPAPLQALRSAIAQLESVEFGAFQVDRFYLFRSQPGSAGSIYTKLSEYPFQALHDGPARAGDRLPAGGHSIRIFAGAMENGRGCAGKGQRQYRRHERAAHQRPRHRGGDAAARHRQGCVRGVGGRQAYRRMPRCG